jgi:thioredoxin-related protein
MKIIIKVLLIIFICFINSQNIYSQNPKNKLPVFRIARTDSTYFDVNKIKKNVPVMFIYFLPDCVECENFTKALLRDISSFKAIKIIMITNASLKDVRQFEKEFKLKKYPNIIVGTEGLTFVFQRQFHIETFPFIVLFDKRDNLIAKFNNNSSPENLVNDIKKAYNANNN